MNSMDVTATAAVNTERACLCGHAESAHEHYRRGSDCALCLTGVCAKFRPAPQGPPVPAPTVQPASIHPF